MTPKRGKRDANEREFVEAWRALGAIWIPQPPEAGFDGILIFRGQVHVVEVKDVSQTNGRYTLTDNEIHMRVEVEVRGGKYEIITNMAQALALVEAG